MASTTTNLGLMKPAYSDDADISDINGNMDLIDAEAGRVRANVAANYDSSETYAVGDYCLHDGSLYKCSTAISSPEAWTAGHWTQIKITGELSALNGNITTLSNNITKLNNTISMSTYANIASGGSVVIKGASVNGGLVILRYYGPNIDRIKAYPVYRQNQYAQFVLNNIFDTSETSANKSLAFTSDGNLTFVNVHSNTVQSLTVTYISAFQ